MTQVVRAITQFRHTALFLIFSLLFSLAHTHAATIIKGNSQVDGETFTFLIDKHAQEQMSSSRARVPIPAGALTFFAADALAMGTTGTHALSVLNRGRDSVMGITPATVTLNAEPGAANPLYNQGIKLLALLEGESNIQGEMQRPAVVTANDDTSVSLITFYTAFNQVLQAQNIKDAAGNVTGGIVGMAGATSQIFAAVKPNGGLFGAANSGIALVMLGTVGPDQVAFFRDIQAPTGTFGDVGLAYPLDITSSLIKINSNLASLGQVVDLYWDFTLDRLFIGLQTTSGAGATDGSRAIVVGHFAFDLDAEGKPIKDAFGVFRRTSKLVLEPFAPTTAFSGLNSIVGATGSSSQVSIQKVRGMFTSTAVHYLIVQGNVGTPAATQQNVFALPLVSLNDNDELNGTLAQKGAEPTDFFGTNGQFLGRGFQTPATVPADATLQTDVVALVGGGILAAGNITDMFVWRDTVFATVATAAVGYKPGVYYSQAIFNENGAIKAWTNWQRAITTMNELPTPDIDTVPGAFLDPATGQFIVLTPNTAGTQTIIKRTDFAQGDPKLSSLLVQALEQQFPQDKSGLLTLVNVPLNAPGIFGTSLLLVTGNDTVAMVESGHTTLNALIPTSGSDYSNTAQFTDGAITQNFIGLPPVKIVFVSGGQLSGISPLCAAAIGEAGSNGWLFVGGENGLAVLSRPDGAGWDVGLSELGVNFEGLTDDMSFKQIGQYKNVRKILYDAPSFLYVLTDKILDRIDLSIGIPGLGMLCAVTIATAENFGNKNGALHDLVVSEKLGLLGGSEGLFRIGNGANIQTAGSVADAQWTSVPLPFGVGVARRIIPITQTGFDFDLARVVNGGMCYVLDSYRGLDRARIHRFSIANVVGASIDDTTVERISDLFFDAEPAFLANIGEFRSEFATDGSLYMHARSQNGSAGPNVKILPVELRTGISLAKYRLPSGQVSSNFGTGQAINSLVRDTASGGFTIAGDFGLRINE